MKTLATDIGTYFSPASVSSHVKWVKTSTKAQFRNYTEMVPKKSQTRNKKGTKNKTDQRVKKNAKKVYLVLSVLNNLLKLDEEYKIY